MEKIQSLGEPTHSPCDHLARIADRVRRLQALRLPFCGPARCEYLGRQFLGVDRLAIGAQVLAPVQDDNLARDPGRGGRGEKHGKVAHFLGLAGPPERYTSEVLL